VAAKSNEKYNSSCIKLFEFIEMLYKGDVEFKKVIEHFSDGSYDGTSNTHVTLNKYLNAMKIFGLKVRKHDNKYTLTTPLYKINFDFDDLYGLERLKKASEILPKGKSRENFKSFVRALEIRFDDESKNILEGIRSNIVLNPSFSNEKILDQIKICENYCQQNQKLEIVYYKAISRKEVNLLCKPIEVGYVKKTVCFKVLGNNGSRVYEIPIEDIKSVKQFSDSVSPLTVPMTVVYRIKNRLALNYKLRDTEKLDKIEDDGTKVIINKGEDLNNLVKRLMKYGTECELVSPKFMREEMIELINKTLSNYK